jgi:hypothetical protein
LWPEVPYDLVRFLNSKGLGEEEKMRGIYLKTLETERKKTTGG